MKIVHSNAHHSAHSMAVAGRPYAKYVFHPSKHAQLQPNHVCSGVPRSLRSRASV